MRRTIPAFCVALAAILISAAAARAHDTWLLPAKFRVAAGGKLELALTSGMAYPASETAIDPVRIERSGVRLGGETAALAIGEKGKDALALGGTAASAGIATLFVELHPRTLDLTPEEVEEYLAEIGAPPSVRERYMAAPAPRRWRETYTKHAKSFVRVGEPNADRSWADPLGLAFELVPESDPTALKPGQEVTVRLLRAGRPAAGMAIGLVREGSPEGVLRTTDDAGHATFPLPQAGRWLLRATELRPVDGKEIDWESDFTTLTFEVP
jgi:uncharacterized GH25 family protein